MGHIPFPGWLQLQVSALYVSIVSQNSLPGHTVCRKPQTRLSGCRADEYAAVGVFTVSDVVDAIQVALTIFIVHVLASGFHDLDRVLAEENLTGWPAEERVFVTSWVQSVQLILV